MYNPYVLIRPYGHLTIVALIELLHWIMWVSRNTQSISVSIVGFGECACTCRMDTPMSHQKQICHSSTKVSWHYKYSLPFIIVQILCFICCFTSGDSYTT